MSFDDLTWTVNDTPIPYGTFLTAVVNFVIIAWILFLIVKSYNRMQKTPDPTTKVCDYSSERDLARGHALPELHVAARTADEPDGILLSGRQRARYPGGMGSAGS